MNFNSTNYQLSQGLFAIEMYDMGLLTLILCISMGNNPPLYFNFFPIAFFKPDDGYYRQQYFR